MSKPQTGQRNENQAKGPAGERRRYDSPVRRQQTSETRARIVAAGAEIVHGLPAWDWKSLTFQAVGERANVSERTVHRHFSTERKLRDAILHRLVEESGVKLEGLELRDFAQVSAQVFTYLSSFAVAPEHPSDPAFAALDQNRREVLLGAVARSAQGWSRAEHEMAAAMLDLLWNVPSYERLLDAWRLEPERAIAATTWVIGLIEEAIRQGRRPGA